MTELPEPLRLANWLEQAAGASSVYRDKAAAELRRMHRELQRLTQLQTQPCAGRNCGSTNPKLHSAECFEDYEKSTGLAQPEQEPVAWVCYGASEKHDIDYFQDEVDAIPAGTQLYASPPPQRKPLTDEEIERACVPLGAAMLSFTEVARAIERAHGIGEQHE